MKSSKILNYLITKQPKNVLFSYPQSKSLVGTNLISVSCSHRVGLKYRKASNQCMSYLDVSSLCGLCQNGVSKVPVLRTLWGNNCKVKKSLSSLLSHRVSRRIIIMSCCTRVLTGSTYYRNFLLLPRKFAFLWPRLLGVLKLGLQQNRRTSLLIKFQHCPFNVVQSYNHQLYRICTFMSTQQFPILT